MGEKNECQSRRIFRFTRIIDFLPDMSECPTGFESDDLTVREHCRGSIFPLCPRGGCSQVDRLLLRICFQLMF